MTEKQEIISGNITGHDQSVEFASTLRVQGSISNGAHVKVKGDLYIEGDVVDAIVQSEEGSVFISGGIRGQRSDVNAFADIRADYIEAGTLVCMGTLYVSNQITNANVYAGEAIMADTNCGTIYHSTIVAGREINMHQLGTQPADGETEVKIENRRQHEMYQDIILYERKIAMKRVELGKLNRIIAVIQRLGDRVVSLPEDKKRELAEQVRLYKGVKNDMARLKQQKEDIENENTELKKVQKVIRVYGNVYPGVEVDIENARLAVKDTYSRVVFYKLGIVIIGSLDNYRQRMREMLEERL